MIYTPQKHPVQAFVLVTCMAMGGILGGYLFHPFFMVVSLIFWMQYTAVLSYLQFRKRRSYKPTSFTKALLNPSLRFFLFEFVAFIGMMSIFKYRSLVIGASALLAWWLFSLNFYLYYTKKERY